MTAHHTILVERVVAAVCRVCDVDRVDFVAPGRPCPPVSRARDLACFTLSGLVPDETAHGVARLLSYTVGLSIEAWANRLAQCPVAKDIVLAKLQEEVDARLVDVEPIRGAIGRQQGRSRAPGGRSNGPSPLVAANGLSGARDVSSGPSVARAMSRIDDMRETFSNGGGI